MTERRAEAVKRDADHLAIGPSHLAWAGGGLDLAIDERDKRLFNPLRRPVRGSIRLHPEMLNSEAFALDPAARHLWHCIAPLARIEVAMAEPGLCWSGSAYFDSNFGAESLEEGFRTWHWSRAHGSGGPSVFYEGQRRDGSHFASALRFAADGTPHETQLPLAAPLPDTAWRMERRTRADRGHARLLRTWEDAPFYARSTVAARIDGERATMVQESLDLDRFASPAVQFMLPYRMPRSG